LYHGCFIVLGALRVYSARVTSYKKVLTQKNLSPSTNAHKEL